MVWICVYIFALYKRDKVYVIVGHNLGDTEDEYYHDEEDNKRKFRYGKQSKQNYVIAHVLEPLFALIGYAFAWFWTRKWVKNHENQ